MMSHFCRDGGGQKIEHHLCIPLNMYCHFIGVSKNLVFFSSSIKIFEPYFQGPRNIIFFELFVILFCQDVPHNLKLVCN